jgi:hypothetical protein
VCVQHPGGISLDLNRNVFRIVQSLTSEKTENPRPAVARTNGLREAAARAKALSPKRRREIAIVANVARWKDKAR